jgi:hypothetical protein
MRPHAIVLPLLLALPLAARAQEEGPRLAIDAVAGTGHQTVVPGMACSTTVHEIVPFEAGGRGTWTSGPLVLRAGAAMTADLAIAEEQSITCMSAGGGFGDPPADEEIGRGNLRFGLQGIATVGLSLRYFGFDLGLLALTQPTWASWAPPVLPSASFRFGPVETHVYLGFFDQVPHVTTGGMARLGVQTSIGERTALDLGAVWGPDIATFALSAGLAHRGSAGERVFGALRFGSRVLDVDAEGLEGGLQVALALGYGWPTG